MSGAEPRPQHSERSDATGTYRAGPIVGVDGLHPAARPRGGDDAPTVRTGSTATRPVRAARASGPLPLPVPGDRIDGFVLEEAIGVGGMGAVFRALDTALDRRVALKVLPPEQADDPEVVQRFQQEARAAARLDHENIARVFTVGYDTKYHYITFEFIDGTTIRQRVERGGRLPTAEAINDTLQIATALVHAAERGVVHRDVKPSNILVTAQGRAKLVDMGLARRFERGGDDGLTQSGMTLGTFDYISPEQARDPRDVDVRSDLYSLGCTLFYMLTGRPPFPDGTVLQKLLQHQEEPPPDVRELNPGVPVDLAAILTKLLAKDRDRRYQSPEQLVRDLLTVAGALGLRSLSPEGLVWLAPVPASGWERHLVWGLPALAFGLVIGAYSWWGAGADTPTASVTNALAVAPVAPAVPPEAAPAPPRSALEGAPVVSPAVPDLADPNAAPEVIQVDSDQDLSDVLAAAPARAVVVLVDDGPYAIRAGSADRPALARRDLTIRAGPDARPVIRLRREAGGRGPAALLDFDGGRVTLMDLEFAVDADVEAGDARPAPAAIRAEGTELALLRCTFRRVGEASDGPRGAAAAVRLRVGRRPSSDDRPPAFAAEACHFGPGQAGIVAVGPADLDLRDCTMAPGADPAIWLDNPESAAAIVEVRLRRVSILAGPGPAFRSVGAQAHVRVDDSAIAPSGEAGATAPLVAIDDPERLDWHGRGNLYGRIEPFLRPTRGPASGVGVVDFATWADEGRPARESGSIARTGRVWDEADLAAILANPDRVPTVAFRLAPGPTPDRADPPGTRQGPAGPLAPPIRLADAPRPAPRPFDRPEPAPAPPPGRDLEVEADAPPPMPLAPMANPDPAPMVRMGEGEPPVALTDPIPAPAGEPVAGEAPPAPPPAAPAEAPAVRTPAEWADALARSGGPAGTIRLAGDVAWDLDAAVVNVAGTLTIRGEPNRPRPLVRFRPDPAAPEAATADATWLQIRAGSVRLEGIDVILPEVEGPAGDGRRAAFAVGAGAELTLDDCSVTVEGHRARSAAVVVRASEADAEAGAPPVTSAATVRVVDSLLRGGGDLVDVAAGLKLVLEVDNAVIAVAGSLVHGHGLPPGRSAVPIRLTIRRSTARAAGGLVQLESSPDEPDLPKAEVAARDSIVATTPQGDPLFRVDGQGTLEALRDRVSWEGQGVAYHQITTYRRDQTAQPGGLPSLYDRPSWEVANGLRESSPVHAELKFVAPWDPDRPAWTLRPDDVRLAFDSPSAGTGPDLRRIHEPPGADSAEQPGQRPGRTPRVAPE